MPEPSLKVDSIWKHPQGATITVYEDGTFHCINAAGHSKRTTATPEKLREGYGRWYRLGDRS